MKGARSFRERLNKDLKNPEFKEAFEAEDVYASIAIQIAKIRQQQHLSQAGLARSSIQLSKPYQDWKMSKMTGIP